MDARQYGAALDEALGRVCHQMGNKQGKQREPIDAQYLRPSGTLYTSCECTPRASLLTSQYRSMRTPSVTVSL